MRRRNTLAFVAVFLGVATLSLAAPTGLWQFDGNLNAQVGTNLTIKGGAPAVAKTAFGTCSSLGMPLIGGGDAQIMRFLPFTLVTEGIEVYGNLPANGGGSYCNRWTIAMDFATTSVLANAFDSWGYSTPFDTSSSLGDDQGEIYFYNNSGTIQVGAGGRLGGYYDVPNIVTEWHRIVFTTDAAVGNLKVYFDGTLIGTYASGTIATSGTDGKYSLDIGSLISLVLFSAASGGDEGGGCLNSLAIYDHILTSEQIAELGGPTAAGISATEPVGTPALKRHSEFVAYVNAANLPSDTGDATNQATGLGTRSYTSAQGGSLLVHHNGGDWDDPLVDIATTGTLDALNGIPLNSPLEIQVEFVPVFSPTGRYEYVDFNVSDTGLGLINGQNVGDLQTRFYNLGYNTVGYECNNAAGNGTFRILAERVNEITNVRSIITYDPGTTQWRVFYEVNNSGVRLEAPGSPKTAARTKTGLRIEAEQDWVPTMPGYDLYIKDVKIYNAIQTTAASGCVSGYVLRHSYFGSPAGSCASDAFWPVAAVRELDSMGMPVADEYNGTGDYVVTHTGAPTAFPNATIGFTSKVADSAEWKVVIKPQFTATGAYQMFNMKIDGSPISFYLGNVSNSAILMFGESNPFSPTPANVVTLATPSDQISSMTLIINYDNATQTYGAFYAVNGGSIERHPSSDYSLVRGTTDGAKVEFQWQVWNATATDAYSVALTDYTETCGIQTIVVPPTSVKDWSLF